MNTNKRAILTATILCGLTISASAMDIRVELDGSGDYTTIQEAINAAISTVDGIIVGQGVFDGFDCNKHISVRGMGPQYTRLRSTVWVENNYALTLQKLSIVGANGYGVYAKSSSWIGMDNIVVANCTSTGIRIEAYANASMRNCTCVYNGSNSSGDGIRLYRSEFITINSCIVAYNRSYGIACDDDYSGSVAKGDFNCVYGNGIQNFLYFNNTFINSTSIDPLFVNRITGDYTLQSTSPCRNKGVPGELYLDPDGSRNDLGAYGGPAAKDFWPYPKGAPVITDAQASSSSVPMGGKLTIRATARVP